MKKILLALSLFLGTAGLVSAQTPQTKTVQKSTTSTKVTKDAPATPKVEVKVKKDGTPDKRYKENKSTTTTTTVEGPKKQDGTPDMRYKVNKQKTTTKTKTTP